MSEISPASGSRSIRPFVKPVALWIVACGVAFGALALGMDQLSRHLPVDSPALPGIEAPTAGEGADGGPSYPSPTFTLASLDGAQTGPRDFLGKVVVIDLWASWCGPCRIQAQYLDALHREYADKDVQFLAINSGEDVSKVRDYVERTPFPYPVLLDPNESVMRRYGSTGLPTMMVVDVGGRVSFLHVGLVDTPTLRREIEKARKGPGPQLAV